MTFEWPSLLWLMLLLPVLIWVYLWMVGRRKRSALAYTGLQPAGMVGSSRWRRHLPAILMLLAIACMLFAISRPVAVMTLPTQHSSIILAMDISGSMRAADIEPSRLEAAQEAARQFVDDVPISTRIGLVTFAGTAATVQMPTISRDDIHKAIDRMELQRGTAVGSGILMSLKTLFPKMKVDMHGRGSLRDNQPRPLRAPGPKDGQLDEADGGEPEVLEPGSVKSMAVILLTDGHTTTGPAPADAAKVAADRGIRIYTVGFGTAEGAVIASDGWKMRVRLDEKSLQEIAEISAADYFQASTADELKKVYKALSAKLVFERQRTEITSLFAALGALFSLISAALSMIWFNRIF